MLTKFKVALGVAFLLLTFPSLAAYQGGGSQKVLASLRAANMNSTADQVITIPPAIAKFLVTSVLVTNCAVSQTLSVGGVYSAASKGGTAIVAAVQAYSALTGTTTQLLPATISAAGLTTTFSGNLYFSLTTALGSAATCDIFVVGTDLT